jgi:hypothetical protein
MLGSSGGSDVMASDFLKKSDPELRSEDVHDIPRSVSTGDLEITQIPRPSSVWGSGGKGLRNTSPSFIPKGFSAKSSPRRKFKWHDPDTGYTLTAGGILFYDDQGMWLIGEKDKSGVVYTDIGGRYAYEDGNIWAAIARELREETYGLCEMFVSDVISLAKKYPPVYVNGHGNQPVYVCLTVPLTAVEGLPKEHFLLDPQLFDTQRRKTLSENPDVPVDYYSPCVLTKLTYDELKDKSYRLSYRLKRILRYSPLFSHLPVRSGSSTPYDTEEDS